MGTARLVVVLLAVTYFTVMCSANEHLLGKHNPHSRVRRQATNGTTNSTSENTTNSNSTTGNSTTSNTQTSSTTTNNQTASTTMQTSNSTTNNASTTTKAVSSTLTTKKSNSTTTRRPTTADRDPQGGAQIPCADNNPKIFTTCCQGPIIDYFSDDLKMKCNYFKKNEPLFSTTNEYILNKMQHRISQTIDYSSTAFVKKFGEEVCLVHCLFRQTNLMDIEGAIDESALSDYAADNLDDTWAQVVRDAVSECVAAVSEVETEGMEVLIRPKVTKMCKLKPSLIMQCIIKAVTVNCPEEYFDPTLLCSRTTSNLRYCNPYAAEASSARVYVRKGSNKSKLVTKAKKITKSTTKTPAVTKKQLMAKKYAPVLRKTKKAKTAHGTP